MVQSEEGLHVLVSALAEPGCYCCVLGKTGNGNCGSRHDVGTVTFLNCCPLEVLFLLCEFALAAHAVPMWFFFPLI